MKAPGFLKKLAEIRFPLDLSRLEKLDRDSYRLIAVVSVGLVVLMLVSGLTAFALSLRGAEQTLVPNLVGMELAQAAVKLQEKELYPRLSLRFTDNPEERGRVVEQKPPAGAIVKAGRRIQLTVSRGPVVDRVGDYVGQELQSVKLQLQALFASAKPLVSVKEPPIYVFDKAAAGTILQQKPLPETEISAPVMLELVVSRGPEKAEVSVPDFRSLGLAQVLEVLGKENVPALFALQAPGPKDKAGLVLGQDPAPGAKVPAGTTVKLMMTTPTAAKGEIAGLFERELPEYPYPLRATLEAVLPSGERRQLLSLNHPGGSFVAPYVLPEASVLVLRVLDRELAREEVRTP